MNITEKQMGQLRDICAKAIVDDEERTVKQLWDFLPGIFSRLAAAGGDQTEVGCILADVYQAGFKAGMEVGVTTAVEGLQIFLKEEKNGQ